MERRAKYLLLRSDRGEIVCDGENNPDLFAATVGGMVATNAGGMGVSAILERD